MSLWFAGDTCIPWNAAAIFNVVLSQEQAVVRVSYLGGNAEELSVKENDVVNIIEKFEPGRWMCEKEGATGLVQKDFLRVVCSQVCKPLTFL